MAQAVNVNLKPDDDVEKRIPSEVSVDPFYSESNMRYLAQKMEDYKAGRLNLAEHELIEE